MEQVKKCPKRVAALVLACFVMAFSISVPAAAAEVTPTQLTGTVRYYAVTYYTDDTYDLSEASNIEYPVYDNAVIKQTPLDAGKYIKYMITQMEFYDVPLNVSLRIHIILQGHWPYVGTLNPRCNMRYYVGSTWYDLTYTTVSSSFSNEDGSWRYDLVADFSLPLEATQLRLQGIVQPTYAFAVNDSYSPHQSFRLLEFSAMDPIVDQTPADKNETDRVDGAVSDKTQQSQQITNQIEQLQKPNVDSSSGKPVVGGMVVDPMQQVDRESFTSYTNVIGAIFGSTTILTYFIIVFSLIFISYVIFGKSG